MLIPKTLEFANGELIILDQTKLPFVEEFIRTDNYERIAEAIERLEVRGAPAIGVATAYAVALAFKNLKAEPALHFNKVVDRLSKTRPTAVNLFYALGEMKKVFGRFKSRERLYDLLLERAKEIHIEDIEMCDRIARNGLRAFGKKSRVLTHCNAGSLATAGNGTALNVIRLAHQNGLVEFVYADETRPLLQGSRLTAWELMKSGIPFAINTDSTAAFLMKQGIVDLVIVGADRIAANGDAANKIGTYNLAVLCKHHKIPFYIAAPATTIDTNCLDGGGIKIEFRNKRELFYLGGAQITLDEFEAYSPAFDVTPAELITAIITDTGFFEPPFEFKNV